MLESAEKCNTLDHMVTSARGPVGERLRYHELVGPPARQIEHDKALRGVMTAIMKDDTELFRQFVDNDSFKRWLGDAVFRLTYTQAAPPPTPDTP